jgi:hypothetical protein
MKMSLDLSSTSRCDQRCTTAEVRGATAAKISAVPAKTKVEVV